MVSQYEFYVGPKGTVGTREQFADAGVNTYLLPTDCVDKDNSTGVDGTREGMFSPALVYQSVQELAMIFDVEAEGEALLSSLKAKEEAARSKADSYAAKDISVVFWYSSADENADAWVAGKNGVSGYLADLLGLRNVIESGEEWPLTDWATIAKANPTYIVIARMDRRKHGMDDYEKKLAFLKSDPVTSQMDAVKADRIIILDSLTMDATLNLFDGIDVLMHELDTYE